MQDLMPAKSTVNANKKKIKISRGFFFWGQETAQKQRIVLPTTLHMSDSLLLHAEGFELLLTISSGRPATTHSARAKQNCF